MDIDFFLKPKETIDFDIKVDRATYIPGDIVSLELSTKATGNLFTSLKVFDVSSLLEIPQYKHHPSLPSMVFLEREQFELYLKKGEFWHSD